MAILHRELRMPDDPELKIDRRWSDSSQMSGEDAGGPLHWSPAGLLADLLALPRGGIGERETGHAA